MLEKINQSAQFILNEINSKPEVGIILGTGLGGLVREIEIKKIFGKIQIDMEQGNLDAVLKNIQIAII